MENTLQTQYSTHLAGILLLHQSNNLLSINMAILQTNMMFTPFAATKLTKKKKLALQLLFTKSFFS